MNSKILIGGLLAGAAIGVAIGLLLSPSTSAKTKEKLMTGARRLKNSLGGMETFKESFNHGVDEVANRGKQVIDSTSERVKV